MKRLLLTFLLTSLSGAAMAEPTPPVSAPSAAPAKAWVAPLSLKTLEDEPLAADAVAGKLVLFVNVASKCGFTSQYAGLQALYKRYSDRGFTVIGVPSNQFAAQEPGSAEDIRSFCSMTYGVTFPILEKQHVNGKERTPLYKHLIDSEVGGGKDVGWNFEKFLVDGTGKVIGRFPSKVAPDDPTLIAAIEAALPAAKSP